MPIQPEKYDSRYTLLDAQTGLTIIVAGRPSDGKDVSRSYGDRIVPQQQRVTDIYLKIPPEMRSEFEQRYEKASRSNPTSTDSVVYRTSGPTPLTQTHEKMMEVSQRPSEIPADGVILFLSHAPDIWGQSDIQGLFKQLEAMNYPLAEETQQKMLEFSRAFPAKCRGSRGGA